MSEGKRLWLFDGGTPATSRGGPLCHSKEKRALANKDKQSFRQKITTLVFMWYRYRLKNRLKSQGSFHSEPIATSALSLHEDTAPFATLLQTGYEPEFDTIYTALCFCASISLWCPVPRWTRQIQKRSVYGVRFGQNGLRIV